jgi:ABC-type branched-subunit amino acid transport system substrate-binding protein
MPRDVQRRDVLKGVGVAGISVGLAGCNGNGNGNGNGNETVDGNGGGTEGSLQVNVRVEDTETRSNAGTEAANRLVGEGVPMICGTASSGVNVDVSEGVLVQNQVVGCSPSSTAISVTDLEDDDYIFRTAPSDIIQGQVDARVMSDRLGASSASTLYVDNDYGQQLSSQFAQSFDGEVLSENGYPQGGSSYSSVVQTAINDNPDGLFLVGYPQDGQQLFRDYYSTSDGSEDVLVPDGLREPALPKQIGNDMDNVTGTAPAAGGPAQEAFTSAFEERYGESPGVFTAQSYDSAAVLILANVAAGENDGTAVRDQIRNVANPDGMEVTPENFVEGVQEVADGNPVNYQGASSSVNFDEAGDPVNAAYDVWEFDGQDSESTSAVETRSFEGDNPDGAGPSAEDIPGSDAGRTVELGILLPSSGNLAPVGEPMTRAAEMAALEVNEADFS